MLCGIDPAIGIGGVSVIDFAHPRPLIEHTLTMKTPPEKQIHERVFMWWDYLDSMIDKYPIEALVMERQTGGLVTQHKEGRSDWKALQVLRVIQTVHDLGRVRGVPVVEVPANAICAAIGLPSGLKRAQKKGRTKERVKLLCDFGANAKHFSEHVADSVAVAFAGRKVTRFRRVG